MYCYLRYLFDYKVIEENNCLKLGNAEEIVVPQVKPPTEGGTNYCRWNYLL